MANVLLVDSDALAQKAMQGILAQRDHRFSTVATASEAWDFIRKEIAVDLVIVELKLKEESGIELIERLKNDRLLNALPIVVYTGHTDRANIKNALDLHVQNCLLKPYHEDAVFAELAKATLPGWRRQLFAGEEDTCRKMNVSPDQLRALRESLAAELRADREPLAARAEKAETKAVIVELKKLAVMAFKAGALGVIACLRDLHERAKEADWAEFAARLDQLEVLARLIEFHLHPSRVPDGFRIAEERESETEAQAQTWWANAVNEDRCPVVAWTQLQRQIEGLPGCPVVNSIAASFQMSANGHPTSLSPLLDLVQSDPGLTAEILIASNRLKKKDGESAAIEDARMAVGLLGERRLAALGGGLVTVEERLMQAPPHFAWPAFRMFQLGTARLARFVCGYLEMPSLEAPAYTAGLLHDVGKLLLVRLHPFALQGIQAYALKSGMKLAAAEKLFLGVTTQEMGCHFAIKHGLPQRFANVMRWIDDPEQATEDSDLVAVVSLARYLCRHNRVGFCGETSSAKGTPIENTPEWKVLRNRVFLNFDLKKFERQAHSECLQIKRELFGQLAKRSVA